MGDEGGEIIILDFSKLMEIKKTGNKLSHGVVNKFNCEFTRIKNYLKTIQTNFVL